MADTSAPVSGTVIGGDFRVESPLAEGGMGAVYVATQISTGKRRALKLMHRELAADAGLQQRFLQEARVSARIESDHVVEVVGAGVDPVTRAPWLAMELLEGDDLSVAMARRGALPLTEVRDILREICHGVGAAHAAGVVHRDLKPENVFLATSRRSGSRFMVKILDFGIAKVLADARSKQTAALGTPEWMSPEQSSPGTAIGPPADVWSIGLLAFTLLTGKSFWKSAQRDVPSSYPVMREMLFDDIPPASRRAAEIGCGHLIPVGFDGWFARAVHRDPAARFADARQAFAALDPVLGGTAAGAPRGRVGDTVNDRDQSQQAMSIGMTVPTPETVRDHASHGPAADPSGWQRAPEGAQKTVAEDPWAALNRSAQQAPPTPGPGRTSREAPSPAAFVLGAAPPAGAPRAAPFGAAPIPAPPAGAPRATPYGLPPVPALTPAGPRIATPPARSKPQGSTGKTVGIVIGALAAAGVLAFVIGFAVMRKHGDGNSESESKDPATDPSAEARRKAEEAKAARDKTTGVMAKIAGGTFRMGLSDEPDESPVHAVTLQPYEMDVTEVTVSAYQACVTAGGCTPPSQSPIWPGAGRLLTVYEPLCNARFNDRAAHPVNCVDWTQAKGFCEWAGKRLPTEEEWDYAARGGVDGARYPWGSAPPNANLVNGCGVECQSLWLRSGFRAVLTYPDRDPYESTAPVGSFKAGDSKFGLHDMQRNVWEWTASNYCSYTTPGCNDARKVFRGRSWDDYLPGLGTGADRFGALPTNRLPSIGFRCAR